MYICSECGSLDFVEHGTVSEYFETILIKGKLKAEHNETDEGDEWERCCAKCSNSVIRFEESALTKEEAKILFNAEGKMRKAFLFNLAKSKDSLEIDEDDIEDGLDGIKLTQKEKKKLTAWLL